MLMVAVNSSQASSLINELLITHGRSENTIRGTKAGRLMGHWENCDRVTKRARSRKIVVEWLGQRLSAGLTDNLNQVKVEHFVRVCAGKSSYLGDDNASSVMQIS